MAELPPAGHHENPHTYVVQDRNNDEELQRLTIQDQATTSIMGGPLAEQADPTMFHRVLDVGCATGGWAIELAQRYPWMQVVGIDISERMIRYAQQRAEAAGVAERVTFQVMDALLRLDFPDNSFDLVNVRSNSSFVRKTEWRKFLSRLQRVLRPSGVLRLTDLAAEVASSINSPALEPLFNLLYLSLYKAGYWFEPTVTSIIDHLEELVAQTQYQYIHHKAISFTFGEAIQTPESQAFVEDVRYAFRTMRPFLEKYSGFQGDYAALYQQAMQELAQPECHMQIQLLTVWGSKPDESLLSETRHVWTLPPAPVPSRPERPNTYVVSERGKDREVQRQQALDQLLSTAALPQLPPQTEPERYRLVLAVGCGPGGRALEMARQYGWLSVAGVDISARMVREAQMQAQQGQMSERVRFYVMDALAHLEFEEGLFDLVEVQWAGRFVRSWEWPRLLHQTARVTRPGGYLCLREVGWSGQSSSAALTRWETLMQTALGKLGYVVPLMESEQESEVATLLQRAGYEAVQRQQVVLELRQEGEGFAAYRDYLLLTLRAVRPFLERAALLPPDYDQLVEQIEAELAQTDFQARWTVWTVWARKHSESLLYQRPAESRRSGAGEQAGGEVNE